MWRGFSHRDRFSNKDLCRARQPMGDVCRRFGTLRWWENLSHSRLAEILQQSGNYLALQHGVQECAGKIFSRSISKSWNHSSVQSWDTDSIPYKFTGFIPCSVCAEYKDCICTWLYMLIASMCKNPAYLACTCALDHTPHFWHYPCMGDVISCLCLAFELSAVCK